MQLINLIVVIVIVGMFGFIIAEPSKDFDYLEYMKSACVETDFIYLDGFKPRQVYDCSNFLLKENK